MKKLFVTAYAKKAAKSLATEGAPLFDTRFVAMGFEVDHDMLLKALLEHADELTEYGPIEYTTNHDTVPAQEYSEINAVQAIALQGYTEGFNSLTGDLFQEYLLRLTLLAQYRKIPPEDMKAVFKAYDGLEDNVHVVGEMLSEGHAVIQEQRKRPRKVKAA